MWRIIAVIPPPPAQRDPPNEAMPPNDDRISDQFHPEDILSSPQRNGLCRYIGHREDHFCFNPVKGFLELQVRGRPQPQARSVCGRNGNMYSPKKNIQDQFGRILNMLFYTFTDSPTR